MTSHGTGKLNELNAGQAQYPALSASPIPIKNMAEAEISFKRLNKC
jgi:hypothetical protein